MKRPLSLLASICLALFIVGCLGNDDSSEGNVVMVDGTGGEGGSAMMGAGGAGGEGGGMMMAAGGAGGEAGMGGAGGEPPVDVRMVASLEISPATFAGLPGDTAALTVTATWSDDTTEDVSAQVEWASSDESVVTISEQTATVVGAGEAMLTATLGEVTATLTVEGIACDYPANDGSIAFGSVFPDMRWEKAYLGDGTEIDFSMSRFFCGPEFAEMSTLIVNLGAGWCGPCSRMTRDILNPQAEDLRALGSEILYLEAQTTDPGTLADGRFSFRHIGALIDDGPGIRVGDKDTLIRGADGSWTPAPGYAQNQPIVTGYPSVWVVRKRDMTLIADQGRSRFYLPLISIAEDPEADWSDPPPPPFRSNCLEGEEEDTEPNDIAQDATRIEAGSYEGAICTAEPDFYRFVINGPWRATLEFDGGEGDLDMYVFDKRTGEAVRGEDGLAVGSNGTGDVETIEYEGPAILLIFGYNSASANYTLRVEEL